MIPHDRGPDGRPDDARWTAGQVDNTDPTTDMMPLSQEGGGGWRAWRALAVRNNVVVDVVIAAPDLPSPPYWDYSRPLRIVSTTSRRSRCVRGEGLSLLGELPKVFVDVAQRELLQSEVTAELKD